MEWNKEEVQNASEALDELFKALPKTKQMSFLGHLNTIGLVLDQAYRNAPEKTT